MANKKKSKSVCAADKLKKCAERALSEIVELAESDRTDAKQKFEIYKWICEMHFGKPGSGKSEPVGDKSLVLSFEGELDKWSK